jgi:Ribbon-helix-helix protein, copG family
VSTRTTLTLEDDVAERLREESRRTGKSFKDVVNESIRTGLDRRRTAPPQRFVVKARPMHAKPGFDFDDIEGLIERLEGPLHR